jgi:peptide/nickel transport system substrate-binding protein
MYTRTNPGVAPHLRGNWRITALAALLALPLSAGAFTSAPELQKLEKDGKLPPVEKRLPDKPEVITPLQSVGRYGGTLRSALRANNDYNAVLRLVGNQSLVRWNTDMSKIVPNVAESWTVNADATEYTFRLRRGMKWSDGVAFTADDILFYTEDLLQNKTFMTVPPAAYQAGGKLLGAEKIDDYTIRFKFTAPYVAFPENIAHPTAQMLVMYPKHYCQKFHPKYNPKVEELVKASFTKDWPTLMRSHCSDPESPSRWSDPEKPTLDPWLVQIPYNGSSTQVVLQRNPYFWQVDTKGQQLPYINELRLPVISEPETIVLAAINGQLDFQFRHIGLTQNLPILTENMAKGGYRVLKLEDISSDAAGLFLNQSTKNEKLRTLIRNKDFRVALSLATNRAEINDIVYLGQSSPWQIGPKKQNRFYNEQLATQYLNYDLKTANALLDKMGLNKRDSEGYRLYPQGERVSIHGIVEISSGDYMGTMELLRRQWSKVGVDLVIMSSERSLYYDRTNLNNYDMGIFIVGGGLDPQYDKTGIFVWSPMESRQSILWAKWAATGGKQGEEPSASMKKRIELNEKFKVAKTQAEADALLRQMLQIAADEFEVIGTVAAARVPGIVSTRLVNVYDKMPWAWPYATPAGSLPQQFYFK